MGIWNKVKNVSIAVSIAAGTYKAMKWVAERQVKQQKTMRDIYESGKTPKASEKA